jgi:hypothetical protein
MSSALVKLDMSKEDEADYHEIYDAAHAAVIAKIVSDGPDAITSNLPEAQISPKISLLLEARRALASGGVLILKNVEARDIALAIKLGFALKEHTRLDSAFGKCTPREVVLQKIASESPKQS